MNNYLMMEHAATIANLPLIKAAIRISGIDCLLYKISETIIDEDDSVYGIYSGSNQIDDTINTNETSNPYSVMTMSSVENLEYPNEDAFDIEYIDTENHKNTEVINTGNVDGINIKILMPAGAWRVISNGDYGYYDFNEYFWHDGNEEINTGDIIIINNKFGATIKFKVTFIESLGNNTIIANRFKVASVS
jgi:hypothetical protein